MSDNGIKKGDKIDRLLVYSLLSEGHDTYYIISNYVLDEDTILDCYEDLDKNLIIQDLDLSESFINKSIEIKYLNEHDIKNLNMKTYSNLSEDFIKKYKHYINWSRMILYHILYKECDINIFTKYINIIVKENLWDIVSSCDGLPIEFIRIWKHKLNWKILSFIINFTEEERIEFDDFLINKQNFTEEEKIEFNEEYKDDISIDVIANLINKSLTKFEIGEKVIKDEKNWISNEFDSWGRGVGVGVIDSYSNNIEEIYVKWINGRSLEKLDQIVRVL